MLSCGPSIFSRLLHSERRLLDGCKNSHVLLVWLGLIFLLSSSKILASLAPLEGKLDKGGKKPIDPLTGSSRRQIKFDCDFGLKRLNDGGSQGRGVGTAFHRPLLFLSTGLASCLTYSRCSIMIR